MFVQLIAVIDIALVCIMVVGNGISWKEIEAMLGLQYCASKYTLHHYYSIVCHIMYSADFTKSVVKFCLFQKFTDQQLLTNLSH